MSAARRLPRRQHGAEQPGHETEKFRDEELLADVICRLIGDVRHVAVGARRRYRRRRRCSRAKRAAGRPYVSLLGSREHTFFTDGARELFDCAGQGRVDVFFLSGGQIDGEGNINLVASATTIIRKRGFPARSAPPISITSCRK